MIDKRQEVTNKRLQTKTWCWLWWRICSCSSANHSKNVNITRRLDHTISERYINWMSSLISKWVFWRRGLCAKTLRLCRKGKKDKVYHLKKALYGIKQAPRNTRINGYLIQNVFTKCLYEHAVYVKKNGDNILVVSLYVDNLLFTRNNQNMFETIKVCLMISKQRCWRNLKWQIMD